MQRIIALLIVGVLSSSPVLAAEHPNVLFIAVDDLRPELGCYGKTHIHSPNMDRLAASGMVFQRAYCMVPTCGASRASLMTGIRPAPTRFVNYLTWAEKDAPGIVTLNTHFRNHGYHTISLGKVFHHPQDNAQGWSEVAWRPRGVPVYRLGNGARTPLPERPGGDVAQQTPDSVSQPGPASRTPRRGPPYESADVPDEAYRDGVLARRAVADLRRMKEQGSPFFLAVGFLKPHLPFVAPKKYWDLYDPTQIHLPANYHVPRNAPPEAIHNSGELRSYAGVPAKGPVSDDMARRLIHGYYACVSYTDAQIGKLLDELDRLQLTDDTIVVLWGDHGWNLGEHTLWCKHCCFETSMHAPLIVRAPGIEGGRQTSGLTEFIDIYPSLCELAGLTSPDHLQGRSFVPLLTDPEMPWKDAAIGRYRSGDTIRTNRFRFSEYSTRGGDPVARMLYDHQNDPAEDDNIAEQADLAETVGQLIQRLHEPRRESQSDALE